MRPHCIASGCQAPYLAKGYCKQHYMRLYRTGSTEVRSIESIPSAHKDLKALVLFFRSRLAEAREIYGFAVGLAVRMRWRHHISQLVRQLAEAEHNLAHTPERAARVKHAGRVAAKLGARNPRWSGVPTETIMALHRAGQSYTQIAAAVGMSWKAVAWRVRTAKERENAGQFAAGS